MKSIRSSRPPADAGFTLLEAMVAVLVLGLGLGASLLTYNMAMRRVSSHGAQMAAMHSGRAQVEMLRTLTWSDPALATGTYPFTNGAHTGSYTVRATGNVNIRDVTVRTDWRNNMTNGVSEAVIVTSLAKPLR